MTMFVFQRVPRDILAKEKQTLIRAIEDFDSNFHVDRTSTEMFDRLERNIKSVDQDRTVPVMIHFALRIVQKNFFVQPNGNFQFVVFERFHPGIELIKVDDDPQQLRGETAQQREIDVDRDDFDRGDVRRALISDDGPFIQ